MMPHSTVHANATVVPNERTTAGPGLAPPHVPALPPRYQLDTLLGVGGMGEVWRVADAVLDRWVAMKITFATTEESRARFRSEAKILARLEHPSIVPIYDLGTLEDGRIWFTMREVAFRTLWELITEVHAASHGMRWGVTASGWSLHRLVLAMVQVCEAVSHAHAVGIAHLDLKPNNVLVGGFGEVQVADWGIARVSSPDGNTRPSGGTPPYMPPEQTLSDPGRNDLLCDVYAIGCMLYTVLAGRPPATSVTLRLSGRASVLPPALPPAPDEIVRLMRACMEPQPADRPRGVGEIATRLRAWIDGSERRGRADVLVADARAFDVRAVAARAAASRMRTIAERVTARVPPFAPVWVKRPGWALETRARTLSREAEAREADEIERLHTALALDPAHDVARGMLGDRYLERLNEADARRDAVQVTRVGAQLRGLQPERWERWSREGGVLTLLTDPPGARATLYRFEERDRQLVPRLYAELGVTPLVDVELAAGSWLVELNAPGCATVRYPVFLERGDHWSLTRPGDSEAQPIKLPLASELGPDDLYVPAGWFTCGTDDPVPDGMSRRRVWVDGFLIRRHPVTVGEYLEFLNDLVAQGREGEAMEWRPVHTSGTGDPGREPFSRSREFELNPASDAGPWTKDLPVVMVDWRAANAFADWMSARSGRTWRLPHELEWEKAARGVDGRNYPWGDELDPAWTNMMLSHAGVPRRSSVTAFPLDESPYRVCGAAGNVREWCANAWTRAGDTAPGGILRAGTVQATRAGYRILRGGSYTAAANLCRIEARFGAPPSLRAVVVGFRVVSST